LKNSKIAGYAGDPKYRTVQQQTGVNLVIEIAAADSFPGNLSGKEGPAAPGRLLTEMSTTSVGISTVHQSVQPVVFQISSAHNLPEATGSRIGSVYAVGKR
jgi:hypothetical protein